MLNMLNELASGASDFAAAFSHYINGLVAGTPQLLVTAMIIIVTTGLLGGMAAKFFKQPLILGYILAGVFVGFVYKASFGTEAVDAIDSLANIGVALLLFSMGLEFSKSDIKPIYKVAVWGTFAQVFFTLMAGGGVAYVLNRYYGIFDSVGAMFVFGTAFVSTSTAVLIKTLTSRGRMGTLSSKVMIGMSIVQDLTVIPVMLVVGKLDSFSEGFSSVLMPIFKGAIFMALMMTLGARYVPLMLKHVARLASKELFLLAVTGIALLAGLISETMELSFSFGALLAGIVLSDSDYGKKALYELMSVRDLFAMLFFVSIGMMLDLHYLVANLPLVIILVIITGLIRTIPLAGVTYISGYRNVIPVAMLFGMTATSEIAFVVIQQGESAGLLSKTAYSLILSVAVCTMLASPMIDTLTAPVYALLKRTIWKKFMMRNDIVMPAPVLSNHIVIAGGEFIARSAAHLFSSLKLPYVLVEGSHESFQSARKDGLNAIFGDPHQEVILEAAGIKDAKIFLAASTSFTDNLAVVKAVREMNSAIPIITRADTHEEVEILHQYKIFEIVQAKFEAALEITRQALLSLKVPSLDIQNYTDKVRFHHYSPLANVNIEQNRFESVSFTSLIELSWICIPDGGAIANSSIGDLHIRTRFGASVVGILRNGNFVSNPSPDYVFRSGDTVAIIGNRDQREAFEIFVDSHMAETPEAAKHMHDK